MHSSVALLIAQIHFSHVCGFVHSARNFSEVDLHALVCKFSSLIDSYLGVVATGLMKSTWVSLRIAVYTLSELTHCLIGK